MSPFTTRAVLLFALAATIPVALTAVVWVAVSSSGEPEGAAAAELARKRLAELEVARRVSVERLCRDDLAVDTLLRTGENQGNTDLDFDRLFRGSMLAAQLDVLWVVDELSGKVVATGHRPRLLGDDGSALGRRVRQAGDAAFLLELGAEEHRSFVVTGCSIARGGRRLTIVGGHRVARLRDLDREQIRVTGKAAPADRELAELRDAEGVVARVVVWRPALDRRGPPLLLWIGCVAALAAGLALLFGGYLNRWLQSSVDALTAAATRVGRGDFDTTLRDDGRGAFPATATAFNRMTRDLRDARSQLRQTERVAAWQDIARSLAHELKNPLSPIRLSIETLRSAHERSPEDFDALFDESTRTILQEVDRLREIVDEFSRFARLPAPELRELDLVSVVSQAASLHADGPADLALRTPSAPVRAWFDPDQITQVVHNLVSNAIDASTAAHPDGNGHVRVSVVDAAEGPRVLVEDDGAGIPNEQIEEIFEPYFSRKRGGTGLGLAITQRIVTEHGGRIEVQSAPGGTRFTVTLRRATAQSRS